MTHSSAMARRHAFLRVIDQMRAAAAPRLAPRDELVNTLEYEDQARAALAPAVASLVTDRIDAGGARVDRQPFDRMTLRPRMLVPALDLDLTVTLFGDLLAAPIIVAPMADQKRFHADGETATISGASLAKAPVVVSSQSSVPIADLKAAATTPLWYQVFAGNPAAARQMQAARDAGCRAIVLSAGVRAARPGASLTPMRIDWPGIGRLVAATSLLVIVKGITSVADAQLALQQKAQGIIVSNYGADPLVLELAAIVDAVGGRVPVLVDGGFRRGTDIVKALAFGAHAVLVGRPVMWGLAAYGAEGVRSVIEMLQTELARYMAMCGKTRIAMLQRDVVRVHAAAPPPATSSR